MCIDEEFMAYREKMICDAMLANNKALAEARSIYDVATTASLRDSGTCEIGVLYDAHPRMRPAVMWNLGSLDAELACIGQETADAGRELSPSVSYRMFVIPTP